MFGNGLRLNTYYIQVFNPGLRSILINGQLIKRYFVEGALPLQKSKYVIATETISNLMNGYFFQVLDVQLMHKFSIEKIGLCCQSEIFNSTFFKIEKSWPSRPIIKE